MRACWSPVGRDDAVSGTFCANAGDDGVRSPPLRGRAVELGEIAAGWCQVIAGAVSAAGPQSALWGGRYVSRSGSVNPEWVQRLTSRPVTVV